MTYKELEHKRSIYVWWRQQSLNWRHNAQLLGQHAFIHAEAQVDFLLSYRRHDDVHLLRQQAEHRNIKSRTNAMVGFKRFRSAATTISGIELMHRIRKGQFDLAKLALKDTAAPAVWNAVLSNR
ncbi:integrase catalytic region [Caballeronia choica]|uniref:Integrase catalytic region n=1 Tax=Caballeronia choica TaxID=326476 RepID=A0A158L3T2_9BURK|nr:integrase catalytic region [Caballeronia choica]